VILGVTQSGAAGHSADPARWHVHFDELMGRTAGRFARVEPRRHARDLVTGMLSGLPVKNCWTVAEHAGDATPDELQHLLARREPAFRRERRSRPSPR
jgi:hypothetical protein